ncbi:MAG: choice-of-anchor D domain-containing protein, partial [Phycisphaerae bacterium]
GDVNADGLPDIIVGAPGDARAFVYSGDQAAGFPLLATLEGGLEPDDRFGASVGRVGDIDGDMRSEVIVGAPHFMAAGWHAGSIYVFSVHEPGDPMYSITGSGPTDLLGTDVDGGRDLNGDSVPDFMGSAMGTDITGPLGFGYVKTYSGAAGSVLQTVTSAKAGDLFGFSAELSDSCSGGKPTLVVGAPQAVDPDTNKITGRVVAFNAATGAQLTEIYGEAFLDGMGIGVGGFVDLTGDGKAEFLAGAHGMSDPPALWSNGSGFVYSCVNIPRPDIVAVPNPANFGDVSVGTTQNMTVQIQNQGDADLVVTGLALTAASNAAFSFSGPSTPVTVPPSSSQSVIVHYSPTTMGIHGGTLQVQSNDPDSPTYDIVLVGKGRQRNIEVTPASANFGAVDVGDTSWASIKVKNTGNDTLSVNSVALSPGSSSDFTLTGLPALPKSLLSGQQFAFQAIFVPSSQAQPNNACAPERQRRATQLATDGCDQDGCALHQRCQHDSISRR